MYLSRHMQFLHRWNSRCSLIRISSRNTSTNVAATEDRIEIPNRIHRSPTDILKALASTVRRDPTGPHFKYHDDPYLIPTTNVGKRTFAMAQEAGRKAAKWIKEEHRELFMHQEAQPPIEKFAPKVVFNEESTVDEATLEQLIMRSQITDAVFVYNLMKEKNLVVSDRLKQGLLELICYYNNEEPLPDELIEERWLKQSTASRNRHSKSWKDYTLAEQLFSEIEPKTAAMYAALIRGMAKYYQVERAYALLNEATEKQLELDTNTFNAIISIGNFLKETADQRWELCCDQLRQMAQMQIKPNLGTLNALLECISTFGNYKLARGCTLKVLSEFKRLGIEPSLGTYYYVLIIFCRDRAPVSHVIVDILREVQDKEFTIEHDKDTFFFVTAMDVCRNHLHDKALAKKIDTLLHTGDNYNLIGDTYKESIYYRHYIALLCQTETIEDFMQTYDSLVPHIYIPEPGIMEEILKAVEINGAIDLVPRLWSDMVIFDHTNRESILTRILNIMATLESNASLPTDKHPLREQFGHIALDIYKKIAESEGRIRKVAFTGQMIGNILALVIRGGDFEQAVTVFTHIDKNQHRIPGTPTDACLLEFVDICIENKAPSQALLCLQYAVENNMDAVALAQHIHIGFTLNEVHLSKIKSLVGDNYLPK